MEWGRREEEGREEGEQQAEQNREEGAQEGSPRAVSAAGVQGWRAGNGNWEQLAWSPRVFSQSKDQWWVVSGEGGADEVPFLKTRGMNK